MSSLLLISNYSFASESSESNSGPVIDEYFTSTVAQKYQRQARNFSGHRIGLGIVDAQYVSESVVKFEYGYEFNGIAGVLMAPITFIGASMYSKQFWLILPAKASANELLTVSSVSTMHLLCFFTEV